MPSKFSLCGLFLIACVVFTLPAQESLAQANKAPDKGKAPAKAPDKAGDKPTNGAFVPALTPEEDIKAFRLPPGLKAECVASEPMIESPVQAAFDADGRLWVVEMRGYMQDTNGTDENKLLGLISILEDADGDGKMDKKTIFMDNINQPRGIGFAGGGIIIVAPPNLWYCKEGKPGVCTEKVALVSDLGFGGNPEYKINTTLRAIDNYLYHGHYEFRFRYDRGVWLKEGTIKRGQYGLTQDNYGRLFFNYNSTKLQCDFVPGEYYSRNPFFSGSGLNVQVGNNKVFLAHHTITNRGKATETLSSVTAACGPDIYRGGLLGPEYEGNAFACEPTGNLVTRITLTEQDGVIKGTNPTEREQKDFLTSTNERFRPVNIMGGPDGAMYIVDMHHGLIQYKAYLQPYAKDGYLARGLEQHINMGRIYRIVPSSYKYTPPPKLSKLEGPKLIPYLADANGWRRDTAQRLLVDRADGDDLEDLKTFVSKSPTPLGKIHALWTLEGLGWQDVPAIAAGTKDADPWVRATAIRVSERLLGKSETRPGALEAINKLGNDKAHPVKLQFCFTMSEFGDKDSSEAVVNMLSNSPNDALLRDAVISGLRGNELSLLEKVLTKPDWQRSSPARSAVLSNLAIGVFARQNGKDVQKLLAMIAAIPPAADWQKEALLDGPKLASESKAKLLRRPVTLPEEPTQLLALSKSGSNNVKTKADNALKWVVWSGKPGYTPPPPPPPLTPAQQQLYELGKKSYADNCAKCHQPDGLGRDGLAPPLLNSEWVLGSDKRMVRGIIAGIKGPIDVDGRKYTLEMPSLRAVSDKDLAAAITYARRSWDHGASAVEPAMVTQIRRELESRTQPFTARELEKLTN